MSARVKPIRFAAMLAAAVSAAACLSCDILRNQSFSVVGWTPGTGRFESGGDLSVSVSFSGEPDRVSVENAFSMTGNGAAVAGTFSWVGATLFFKPCIALRGNTDFRVTVGAGAMNPRGVSLEDVLEGRFSTRPEDGRPSVLSTIPERGGMLAGVLDSVSVSFSEQVDSASFRGCMSFSPAISGVWRLDPDGETAVFLPLAPWVWATEYRLIVSGDLADASGNRMGESASLRFTVGNDAIPPSVTGAQALDKSGSIVSSLVPDDTADGSIDENTGWEAEWRVGLAFSETVSMRSLGG
ncbi:MAG: hypothetical protein CVV51_03990, partial [Spirochaetae bacterium HGW-Spirochaetae-7]